MKADGEKRIGGIKERLTKVQSLTLGVNEDQRLTFGQCLGRLFASAGDDALHRAPRNAHPGSGFFLGQPFKIAESQRLQFIAMKIDLMQFGQRRSGWLKCASAEIAFTVSKFLWPWGHVV